MSSDISLDNKIKEKEQKKIENIGEKSEIKLDEIKNEITENSKVKNDVDLNRENTDSKKKKKKNPKKFPKVKKKVI